MMAALESYDGAIEGFWATPCYPPWSARAFQI